MDMGSAEAGLTQMSTIPTASSYFLQLDPSGQIDILESSLVLNKPDMADETVYEIQLDPYMMDERNVEVINMQNFQNTVTFQPEYVEEHHFSQYDHQQIQYQIEDVNFSQMLPISTTNNEVVEESVPVPDYTVETEIISDCSSMVESNTNLTQLSNSNVQEHIVQTVEMEIPYVQDNQIVVEADQHVVIEDVEQHDTANESSVDPPYADSSSNSQVPVSAEQIPSNPILNEDEQSEATNPKEKEICQLDEGLITEEAVIDNSGIEVVVKEEPEELDETEASEEVEAYMPPLVEMYPSPPKPIQVPVVTIYNDEPENLESSLSPLKPKLLHDDMDPDDELYISYHSNSDPNKTALCVLCYDWFDTLEDLETHLKKEHQDNMKLYGCKKCGKTFWSRFLRQRHEKIHRFDLKGPPQRYYPKNRPFDYYEANHFYKRFRPAPIAEEFRDHIRLIHSEIKSTEYDCIDCGKCFQSEEEYREHYDEDHAMQTCIHCAKVFENLKLLRSHEQEVHGLFTVNKNYPGGAWKLWESWDCEELKERDQRIVNMSLFHNYHKRLKTEAHPEEETSSNTCDKFESMDCEEITVTDYEAAKSVVKRKSATNASKSGKGSAPQSDPPKLRKTDMKTASKLRQAAEDYDQIVFVGLSNNASEPNQLGSPLKPIDLPFKCDTCKTSFDNVTDLQRHIKSHGVRTMAYMCQYCGRGFATHSNRKEHERIHTGDKPYVCPICARAFVQISNLKKHIQTHKDKNNLQCSTCNKQFVKESSLLLHQRAHSQDRKFRCHICDRAYNYASLLKRHMRIHTGENPYSCDDCGMQFHELVSLHYHRKKVHTGERPHRCETCGRAFILSSDLKKHLKIHLKEKEKEANAKSAKASNLNHAQIAVTVGASAVTNDSYPDDESLSQESSPSDQIQVHFEGISEELENQEQGQDSIVDSEPSPSELEHETVVVVNEIDLLNTDNESNLKEDLTQDASNNESILCSENLATES